MSHLPQDHLREPVRPMPASLRRRLLAIPAGVEQSEQPEQPDEVDRLYAAALAAAHTEQTNTEQTLHTTSIRAAVVSLLAAVFRDARRLRPVPERLAADLRTVAHRAGSSRFTSRWITEPRWAAAACWLLAFALTLGTGDAVAGLLVEAPERLQTRSAAWAQKFDEVSGDLGDDLASAARRVRDEASAGYDLVRSRAFAAGTKARAWGDRTARKLDQAWSQFATSALATAFSTPNEPLPQEAQNDR